MKLKTILALLAMVFLVFASQADAQNWVLWQHVITQKEYWYILEAFPSYELCMKEWNKNVSFPAINTRKVGKGEFLIKNEDGTTYRMEFKCIPDTIDPRK
jgi:hypothetical protein